MLLLKLIRAKPGQSQMPSDYPLQQAHKLSAHAPAILMSPPLSVPSVTLPIKLSFSPSWQNLQQLGSLGTSTVFVPMQVGVTVTHAFAHTHWAQRALCMEVQTFLRATECPNAVWKAVHARPV